MKPLTYNFQRYLAAKKTVDDRALNRNIWNKLHQELTEKSEPHTIKIVELGCGIGTMVERVLDWHLVSRAEYIAVDSDPISIKLAKSRVKKWGLENGFSVSELHENSLTLEKGSVKLTVRFENSTVQSFRNKYHDKCDLLIAHALLDLLVLSNALPEIFDLLIENGLYYFTINFDGVTVIEPEIMPRFEAKVIAAYHQSMDFPVSKQDIPGGSKTGRRLFNHLRELGAKIIEAGSSDWVVYPGPDGYYEDERYFLHHILYFFETSLSNHPSLNKQKFEKWLDIRRRQVDQNSLIFIAHQLDILGRK